MFSIGKKISYFCSDEASDIEIIDFLNKNYCFKEKLKVLQYVSYNKRYELFLEIIKLESLKGNASHSCVYTLKLFSL